MRLRIGFSSFLAAAAAGLGLWAGSWAQGASADASAAAAVQQDQRESVFTQPSQTPATAPGPREPDLLAADSLRDSASALLYSSSQAPARARRLVALAFFAQQLAPGDARIEHLLADVYEIQGKYSQAAMALETCIRASPDDYAFYLQRLRLRLLGIGTAPERAAFLQSLAAQGDLPEPMRAQASAELSRVLLGQGQRQKALEALYAALALDGSNPLALNDRLELLKEVKPADNAATLLGLLRGNPLAVEISWKLALLLDSMGLYDPALLFFDYAWEVNNRRGTGDEVSLAFVTQYFNAMLDAGQYRRAIETFGPIVAQATAPGGLGGPTTTGPTGSAKLRWKEIGESVDMQSLLIEAYRALGDEKNAHERVRVMELNYDVQRLTGPFSPALASELAWFYLVNRRNIDEALKYAHQGASGDDSDPVAQRILGVAELASQKPELVEKALERLKRTCAKDAYAAAFLAEHDFAQAQRAPPGEAEKLKQDAAKVIEAAAALGRSGPAFRRLAAVASTNGVRLGAFEGASKVLKVLQDFQIPVANPSSAPSEAAGTPAGFASLPQYLQMALRPEDFIAVEMTPLRRRVAPGEAIELEATLANRGTVDVPIGNWGLVSPVMSLQVLLAVSDSGTGEYFVDLPMVAWSCGRYLPPGKSVKRVVRLDHGRLAVRLNSRPLEEFHLAVLGVLDPIQKELVDVDKKFLGLQVPLAPSGPAESVTEGLVSSLPAVRVAPTKLVRLSLLGESPAVAGSPGDLSKRYASALNATARDLKEGKMPVRMRAARQIASLLAFAHDVETNKAGSFGRGLDPRRGVLLSMVKGALADPSDVVRAEMLAALCDLAEARAAPGPKAASAAGPRLLANDVMPLLAPAIEDPSPLVRFRLVELLGATQGPGYQTIVDYLLKDRNEMVVLMAAAFRPAEGGK